MLAGSVGKALAGALIVLLASAPGSGLSSSSCGRTGQFDEGCRGVSARGDIEGTDVVLSGSVAIPGAPSAEPVFGRPSGGDPSGGDPSGGGPSGSGASGGGASGGGPSGSGASGSGASGPGSPSPGAVPGGGAPGLPPGSQVVIRDGYTVTSAPGVRLSDLIRFRPAPPISRMEPNGWTVVGLQTNFFALAAPQLQYGSLLGRLASVRFTPVRYRWDYGDGSTLSTPVKGARWAFLGQAEFSRTATSHLFRSPGSFSVSLYATFIADYRFAGMDWTRIEGALVVPAERLRLVAVQAKTVLVGRDCSAAPAPGC